MSQSIIWICSSDSWLSPLNKVISLPLKCHWVFLCCTRFHCHLNLNTLREKETHETKKNYNISLLEESEPQPIILSPRGLYKKLTDCVRQVISFKCQMIGLWTLHFRTITRTNGRKASVTLTNYLTSFLTF